jgi:hypothetical protein
MKNTQRFFQRAAVSLVAIAICSFAATASHAATTTVRPDDLLATPAAGGWWFAEDAPSLNNATGSLVQGPGVPPVAVGSARMVLDGGAAGRMLLGTVDYNGTRLDQLTALTYSAYRASADAGNLLAISLQINIDYDLNDASTGWQGRLVFEPYFTVGSGTILEDTWYDYNPNDGGAKWYQTGNAIKAGVNVGNPCPQAAPCTLSAIKALYPNAGIHVTLGAVQFKAGAPWPNFDGNIDDFTIGVSGNSTTWDFEAAKVCAAARYVDPAGSNAGNDCDDSGSPCLTVQYAVDQACNGETVNVAAGTYTEQVTIGQSVSLAGAGAGSTTIVAPAAASRVITPANHGLGDRNYDYLVGVFGRNIDLAVAPDTVPDETDPRVNAGDAPAGYGPDSWQGPATGKTNWHARYLLDGNYLSALFPADAATLTLSDIASISYYTKRPTGTPAGRDWWIQIYTRPTGSGDAASWYHDRFINNYNDHAALDTWTRHSTDSGMTFNMQTPVGPELTLAQMIAAEGSQLVEMISVQTDSGWGGFDGYLDGLEITLTNGRVARVSFDATSAIPEPDTVNISGFTLDGNLDAKASGPGTFRSGQITFLNASGAITDNTLVDWQRPASFGAQGVSSMILGSAGAASATVDGNTVTGYQKTGIAALGTGAMDVTISNNVVTGAGAITSTAQNGIQVSPGVTATIEYNTVSGNNYTPASFCSAGILVSSTDNAMVQGNDLADNLCDIYVFSNDNTVQGNNIPAAVSWPVTVLGNGNFVTANYVNGAPSDAIYNDGTDNTYTCNRLTNNTGGIYFDVFSTVGTPNAATENAVYGNGYGMDASAVVTIPPVDARDNWWGCATGANTVGCDTAVGNLDSTPSASVEPACVTCAGAGGDTDEDGECDPADNCPLVANAGQENADADSAGDACEDCDSDPAKLVAGICGCGTADTDTDGDLTADCNETCDNDPAKLAPGACGCGALDTDTDGDLTADCNETCDNDPAKLAPGACGCGVPDTDTDGDLTADCNETCDGDPAKLAPGACGCGVPDTDTDGDLTADCNETCDGDPAKLAPGQCGCGIADTDTDGDLTADCNDACPNDALDDVDGDTVCGDVDNCPVDANTDQADLDNDDVGDVCDSLDAGGTMLLSQVTLVAANPANDGPGKSRISAVVIDSLTGSQLPDDLALGNVYMEVAAGLFTVTMPLGTCESSGNRIRCRNDVDNVRATFSQLIQGDNDVPDSWKVRVRQRRITNDAAPTGPASVSLVQPTPSITRADTISACDAKPQKLHCRED